MHRFASLFASLSKLTIHAGAAKPAFWHSLSTQFLPFKDLQKGLGYANVSISHPIV